MQIKIIWLSIPERPGIERHYQDGNERRLAGNRPSRIVGMVPAGSEHHIARQIEGKLARDAGENPMCVAGCQTAVSIPLPTEELHWKFSPDQTHFLHKEVLSQTLGKMP